MELDYRQIAMNRALNERTGYLADVVSGGEQGPLAPDSGSVDEEHFFDAA